MIHEKSEMFAIGAISVALILSVWFNYIEIATMFFIFFVVVLFFFLFSYVLISFSLR